MLFYRARYYDPSVGRFLSEDPLRFRADSHFYRYVGNDPVNFIDPDGKIAAAAALTTTGPPAALAVVSVASWHLGSWLNEEYLEAPIQAWIDSQLIDYYDLEDVYTNSAVKCPPIPRDPASPPGPEWEWRGKGEPGTKEGSWYNPQTGESLHPDLNHPDPIGPHWDYKAPDGTQWRVFPDGSMTPK